MARILSVIHAKFLRSLIPPCLAGLLLVVLANAQSKEGEINQATGVWSEAVPVTLSMKWSRGNTHYGPNFIWLSAPCQSGQDKSCKCEMAFKITTSQQFADYISSFGPSPVPVIYQVLYGRDGSVHIAQLQAVGSWPADRFHPNEKLIGTTITFKADETGHTQHPFRNPGDCFPAIKN